MTVSFVLMVNKQGQTRLSQYVDWLPMKERNALESEIIRKCLSRNENQCSFVEYRGYKVVYRRYASLFFIVGTKDEVVRAAVFFCAAPCSIEKCNFLLTSEPMLLCAAVSCLLERAGHARIHSRARRDDG